MGQKSSEVVHAGFTLAFDYNTTGDLIYFGKAEKGATKAAATWTIMKLTYDFNSQLTDIQWADGNNKFDNVWNDRATLAYS